MLEEEAAELVDVEVDDEEVLLMTVELEAVFEVLLLLAVPPVMASQIWDVTFLVAS